MNKPEARNLESGKIRAALAAVFLSLALALAACGGGGGSNSGDDGMKPDSGGSGNSGSADGDTGNVEPTLYFSNSIGTSGLADDGTYPITLTRIVFTDVSGTGKNGPLASDQDNLPQLTVSYGGNTVEFAGSDWNPSVRAYMKRSGSFTAYGWWASDGDHVDVAVLSTERQGEDGEVDEAIGVRILHGTATAADSRPMGTATYSRESGFRASERASYTTWGDALSGTRSDGPNYRGDVSVSFDFSDMDYEGTVSNITATGKFRAEDSTPTDIGNITFGSDITDNGFSADGAEITWAGRDDFQGTLQGNFFGPNGEEIGAVFHGTNGGNRLYGHLTAEKE